MPFLRPIVSKIGHLEELFVIVPVGHSIDPHSEHQDASVQRDEFLKGGPSAAWCRRLMMAFEQMLRGGAEPGPGMSRMAASQASTSPSEFLRDDPLESGLPA